MSSGADRQRAYRVRQRYRENRKQINAWVDGGAFFALERLARRNSVTQREMLEKLINDADKRVLKKINVDTPEWNEYFGVTE